MFNDITFYPILGKPAILWGGVFTGLCFLATAAIGFLTVKGIRRFPFSWHSKMAYLSIALALIHGVLGVLAFF